MKSKKEIASFLGPQLGLSVLGEHCYAYSGSSTVTGASSADTTLLNFNSSKNYIVGNLQPFSTARGSAQLYLVVKFNNQIIINAEFDDSGSINPLLDSPILLIIPPLTNVNVLVGLESGTNKAWSLTFTGRVYS